MQKVIKNCRGVKKGNDGINRTEKENQRENFRFPLGFKENDMYESKESSVLKSIMDTFEGENMETEYNILNYKIDLYFCDYKLAVEIDENGHRDRNSNHRKQRQKEIENELNCKFVRISPDEENFNISTAKHKIFRHNQKSIRGLTKNEMIDDAEKFTKMVKQMCV